MSVVEALNAARAAGVELAVDGDHLALKAASAPPAAVLDALSRHKAEIVMLLRPGRDGWSAEDWRARFDERAGFLEHDGGLSPLDAEVKAFEYCIVEWLNANPVQSLAGRCAWCGKVETRSIKVVPFGAGEHHAWLHAYCWPAWHHSRRTEAAMALRTMGIAPRGSLGDHDD
jgi:hypothetical protein